MRIIHKSRVHDKLKFYKEKTSCIGYNIQFGIFNFDLTTIFFGQNRNMNLNKNIYNEKLKNMVGMINISYSLKCGNSDIIKKI